MHWLLPDFPSPGTFRPFALFAFDVLLARPG
jgi:hypothetical protein